MERKQSEEFVEKVYASAIEDPRRRIRQIIRCMKVLLIEREVLNKQGGSVWIRRGGSSSAVVIPLVNIPGGQEASKTIDR